MRSRALALTLFVLIASLVAHSGGARPNEQIVAPRPADAAPAPAPVPSPATATGAISGVVTDATTGRPVAGAVVSLGKLADVSTPGQASPPQPRALTDTQGRFVFRDLPASPNYYLGARRFGYAYTRYGWTAPGGSLAIVDIARVAVAEDQWVDNIKIPLWRLGVIAGRVLDERNEPVVGVAVRVFSNRTVAGRAQQVAGPIATTDDRGAYRLPGLEPGRYVVAVLSVQSTVLSTTTEAPQLRPVGELTSGGIGAGSGSSVSTPGIDVDGAHRLVLTNFPTPPPPNVGQRRAYPPLFYPAALTFAEATGIEIGYGDTRTGIDFQLRPVPTVRVSGRLESQVGAPPQFLLRLMQVGNERLGFGSEIATTVVAPDGTFTFLNVPEGSYSILAQASVMDFWSGDSSTRFADAPGFPGGGISVGSMRGVPGLSYLTRSGRAAAVWGRTPISVGARDVNDVVVALHPAVKVRGRLVFAEAAQPPPADRPMLIIAQPATGDPTLGQPMGRATPGDPMFGFTIDGLMAGSYLISSFSGGLDIVSVTWRGTDVTDTGLDASLGRDIDDVVVTLTDKATELRGVVRSSSGPTVAAVLAFPVEPNRWTSYGWNAPRFGTTRSGSGGAFRLRSLREGDYYLVAVDTSKIDAWTDPRFLAAVVPLATRVSLKWGDSKSQDLVLVDVPVIK